jgi:hypothetical protein
MQHARSRSKERLRVRERIQLQRNLGRRAWTRACNGAGPTPHHLPMNMTAEHDLDVAETLDNGCQAPGLDAAIDVAL